MIVDIVIVDNIPIITIVIILFRNKDIMLGMEALDIFGMKPTKHIQEISTTLPTGLDPFGDPHQDNAERTDGNCAVGHI